VFPALAALRRGSLWQWGRRCWTPPGMVRPWPHCPPVRPVPQARDGAGGYPVPASVCKRFFARMSHGHMPRLPCCEKRRQHGALCLSSKRGVWPSALPRGRQGVRPMAIIGRNELPDRQPGQAEPARAIFGRSRLHQGMTHDQPASDAPKSREVLEPCLNFPKCQRRFDTDDGAHRPAPHGRPGPT